MPKTIAQGFEKLRENLEITDLQEKTVATRQQNLRDVLEKKLAVIDTFLTGSYRRSTMIRPLSDADVDIFVVLHAKYFGSDEYASLLDLVKSTLKETYRTPKVSRNGQAVTITFEDFRVDVVPGFNRKGGGYLIPDPTRKRWISTDPKVHVDVSTKANNDHDGDLVPLIKMIKAWNRHHAKDFFESFHLEVTILHALHNVKINNSWSGVRFFLDKAQELVKKPLPDPAGYDSDVGAYIATAGDVLLAMGKLAAGLTIAQRAERLGNAGYVSQAYDEWRKLFGDYFPAYG